MKTQEVTSNTQNLNALEASLWYTITPPSPETQVLSRTIQVDVTVIGGGYTGLSTALHLAENHKSVAVLEAKQIGWGASGRNGGAVTPYWWSQLPADIIGRHGPDKGDKMNRMIAESAGTLSDIIQKHDIDCHFRRTGMLMVAETTAELDKLNRRAEQWGHYGLQTKTIPRGEISSYIPTVAYSGGVLFFDNAKMNPLALCRGLARAAQTSGAQIYTDTPAITINRQGDKWKVSSKTGEVVSDYVLIATNAYSGSLWPGLERCYYKVPLVMFSSDPDPDTCRLLFPKTIPFHDSREIAFFGVFFDEDSRIYSAVVPGNSYSMSIDAVTKPFNIRFHKVFPQIPQPSWRHLWYGDMCVMPRFMPKVFRLAPGVVAAMGYSGVGTSVATALGRELAALIATDDEAAFSFPLVTLKPVPLARSLPLLLKHILNPLFRQAYRF